MLGINTTGKSEADLMDEITQKVIALTKDYDTVNKNYNQIVKKIYGADNTVDISNKSVDEILKAIDSLSGNTSSIAKKLQEAITGNSVSESEAKELSVLLEQVKTMKSNLEQKSNLLNQIMQVLGITDSAQIIQTILQLKSQITTLEKENAELKSGDATVDENKGYTKDTEVNTSSASYKKGYNDGYSKAASELSGNETSSLTAKITSLANKNNALAKENASLKVTNKKLTNDYTKTASMYKNLQNKNNKLKSNNANLSARIKTLTGKNGKLSALEKNLRSQISSLKNQINGLKKDGSSTVSSNANRYNSTNKYSNSSNESTSYTASVKPSNESTKIISSTKKKQKNKSESYSSTNKTKKNKKSNTVDKIESENITRDASLSINSGAKKQLGEAFETTLPETTIQAENQQASTTLNKIDDSKTVDITTNAKDTNNATDEQKNNALKIVNWYMNNLEELGNLGSTEITAAATDASKSVTFDMFASFDVTPSSEQQNSIDKNQDVNLSISSPDIEDGALYLVIHESDLRANTFDVLLTKAYGNEIDINVPDLSPITLTKITVDTTDSISSSATQLSAKDTPQEIQNNAKDNSKFKGIIYIFIIVAVGGAATFLVLAKRKKR